MFLQRKLRVLWFLCYCLTLKTINVQCDYLIKTFSLFVCLKSRLHLALWFVMHIMKLPLKKLMKKTHLIQLVVLLRTHCNALIYYHIIPAELYIYYMCTPYRLNYKIDWKPHDRMQCTDSNIIYTSYPFNLSCISSLY